MKNKTSFLLLVISSIILLLFAGCRATNKPVSFYVFSDTHCIDTITRYNVLDSMIADANTLYQQDYPVSKRHLKKQRPKSLCFFYAEVFVQNARLARKTKLILNCCFPNTIKRL